MKMQMELGLLMMPAHEPGLQAHVGFAHVALDLRLGHQGGHGVDDHDVHRAGAHQGLADFQGLLAGVRLGDVQLVDIHAQGLGIDRIQGVLGVDEGGRAAQLLGLGHHVQGHGGLARGLGPVDLDDASLGDATHAQGDVQLQAAGGDHLHVHVGGLPKLHDRALAKLLFDVAQRQIQRLFLFLGVVRGRARVLVVVHRLAGVLFLGHPLLSHLPFDWLNAFLCFRRPAGLGPTGRGAADPGH